MIINPPGEIEVKKLQVSEDNAVNSTPKVANYMLFCDQALRFRSNFVHRKINDRIGLSPLESSYGKVSTKQTEVEVQESLLSRRGVTLIIRLVQLSP